MNDKISVIMPAYNASQFIREAVESILNQTYDNLELIVVDDGSTDDTLKILAEYQAKDQRIMVIQNDHGGACKARNTAMHAASGEWIAPMDADDIAVPNRLEKQLEAALAQPEVVMWGTYMQQINVQGKIIGTVQIGPTSIEEFNSMDRSRNAIIVTTSTAFFKRDIALKVGGYDERLPAAQDAEFADRIANEGAIVFLPEFLIKYRLHGNSISAKKFSDQRMYHQFILARNKAKQHGNTLDMQAFVDEYKQKPPLERFFRDMHNKGRLYYRNTGVYLSQKQYAQAILSLTLSVVLSPKFSISRIWNRLFPGRFV